MKKDLLLKCVLVLALLAVVQGQKRNKGRKSSKEFRSREVEEVPVSTQPPPKSGLLNNVASSIDKTKQTGKAVVEILDNMKDTAPENIVDFKAELAEKMDQVRRELGGLRETMNVMDIDISKILKSAGSLELPEHSKALAKSMSEMLKRSQEVLSNIKRDIGTEFGQETYSIEMQIRDILADLDFSGVESNEEIQMRVERVRAAFEDILDKIERLRSVVVQAAEIDLDRYVEQARAAFESLSIAGGRMKDNIEQEIRYIMEQRKANGKSALPGMDDVNNFLGTLTDAGNAVKAKIPEDLAKLPEELAKQLKKGFKKSGLKPRDDINMAFGRMMKNQLQKGIKRRMKQRESKKEEEEDESDQIGLVEGNFKSEDGEVIPNEVRSRKNGDLTPPEDPPAVLNMDGEEPVQSRRASRERRRLSRRRSSEE